MEEGVWDAIKLLEKLGYIVVSNGSPFPTNKMRELLKEEIKTPALIPTGSVKTTPVQAGNVKPIEQLKGLSPREALKKFIKEAEIPFRIQNGNFSAFTASAPSDQADKKFQQILKNPDIDYNRLVASTKAYYADLSLSRVMISRYLLNDIWEYQYNQFKPKPSNPNSPKRSGEKMI